MPALDRRITVRRTAGSRDERGRYVEATTDFPVWATRMDASAIDALEQGGQLNTSARTYMIRWRQEIAEAIATELSVIEGTVELSVNNIVEQVRERDNRRRFLRLETLGEVTP